MIQLLIRVGAWRALTSVERMCILAFACKQNQLRWEKKGKEKRRLGRDDTTKIH